MNGIAQTLKYKVAGKVPVWLLLIVIIGGAIWYMKRQQAASAAAPTDATSTTSGNTLDTTDLQNALPWMSTTYVTVPGDTTTPTATGSTGTDANTTGSSTSGTSTTGTATTPPAPGHAGATSPGITSSGGATTPPASAVGGTTIGGITASPTPAPKRTSITYAIKSGDTLSAIAARYHVSLSALETTNKSVITNTAKAHGHTSNVNNYIYPGEKLVIPA